MYRIGEQWRGATLNGVDNVGSVEESKYSACLHTNKTKKSDKNLLFVQ